MLPAGAVAAGDGRPRRPLGLGRSQPGVAQPRRCRRASRPTPRSPPRCGRPRPARTVDGVFAIDPFGLQALHRGLGPGRGRRQADHQGQRGPARPAAVVPRLRGRTRATRTRAGEHRGRAASGSSDIARAVIDQLDQKGWDVANLVEDLQHRGAGPPRHGLVVEPGAAAGLGRRRDLGPAAPRLAAARAPEPGRQQARPVPARDRGRSSTGRSRRAARSRSGSTSRNETPGRGPEHLRRGPVPVLGRSRPGEYRGILSVNMPGVARDIEPRRAASKIVAGRARRADPGDRPPRSGCSGASRSSTSSGSRLPEGYEHVTIEPSARYPAVTWTVGRRDLAGQQRPHDPLVDAVAATLAWSIPVSGVRPGSGRQPGCNMGQTPLAALSPA